MNVSHGARDVRAIQALLFSAVTSKRLPLLILLVIRMLAALCITVMTGMLVAVMDLLSCYLRVLTVEFQVEQTRCITTRTELAD